MRVCLIALAISSGCSVSHITAGNGRHEDAGVDATGDATGDALVDADADVDPSLVAHFAFEEGAGDETADSVNGVVLSRVGASWDSGGKRGGAFSFDGVDDYLELDTPGPVFDFGSGDFTLTAWVKGRSFVAAGGGQQLVMGRGLGADPQPGYRMYFQWTDFHRHDLTAGIADGQNHTTLPPENQGFFEPRNEQWLFVAARRGGTQLTVWLDDAVYKSVAPAIDGDIDVEGKFNDKFRIGALPYQGLWPFDGWIDEVRIYDRALEDSELRALFEAG